MFKIKHVAMDEADDANLGGGAPDADVAKDGAAPQADPPTPQIPKARFDEAVARERAKAAKAEARLKELEAELETKKAGLDAAKVNEEIEGLEADLDKAIADGDEARKKALRAEIREKMGSLARAEAEAHARYATAVAVEQMKYNATVAELETAHPEINPDNDSYSEEIVTELAELKAAYEAAGMGSNDALKKAAKYIFRDAPKQASEELKDKDKGKDDKAGKDAAAAVREAEEKAREAAIKRGAEAKGRQPAAPTDKAGVASDKAGAGNRPAVAKMSDKDFDKLSDEEKARLRGDFV